MWTLRICSIFSSFVLFNCAGAQFQKMNADYKGKDISGKTIILIPIGADDVRLNIPEHFIDDFEVNLELDPNQVIVDTVNHHLKAYLNSTSDTNKIQFLDANASYNSKSKENFETVH